MKNLTLLSQDTAFKLGDTGTKIQFRASNDGNPVGLSTGQTANFRIKNNIGFLKTVQADTSVGGYVFELDTSQLTSLVPGTYEVELDITVSQGDDLIFPDTGFVSFSISQNALNITGEQLPMMNLQDFKNEVLQYTQQQISGTETQIENQFQQYVDNLQSSTIKQAQEANTAAQNAQNAAQQANENVQGFNPGFDLSEEVHDKKVTDVDSLPIGIHLSNGYDSGVMGLTNLPPFALNCWGNFIVVSNGRAGDAGRMQVFISGQNSYMRTRNPDHGGFTEWSQLGGTTGGTNLLLGSLSHNDGNWSSQNNDSSYNETYRGSSVSKINQAWCGVGPRLQNLFDRQVVNTDDFYVFSVYAKADSGVQLNNNNAYFFNADNTINVFSDVPSELAKINTEWHQLHVVFKFNQLSKPQSGKDYIRFELSQNLSNGSVYFTCPKLERGMIASDYSPSPEDANTDIQQMQSQIVALTQQIATLQKK